MLACQLPRRCVSTPQRLPGESHRHRSERDAADRCSAGAHRQVQLVHSAGSKLFDQAAMVHVGCTAQPHIEGANGVRGQADGRVCLR